MKIEQMRAADFDARGTWRYEPEYAFCRDLTGRGLGLEFFRTGPRFGRERYRPRLVQLHVAAFNERAIKVYERAGFRETSRHVRTFEQWGDVEFVTMQEQR